MQYDQQDFFTGKLLGDGSLEYRGSANSRFQVRHSIKQKLYVDWCYLQIKEFTASPPKIHLDSYYFRTRSLSLFSEMRKKWYLNKTKRIPEDLVLRAKSLAIWYMYSLFFHAGAKFAARTPKEYGYSDNLCQGPFTF